MLQCPTLFANFQLFLFLYFLSFGGSWCSYPYCLSFFVKPSRCDFEVPTRLTGSFLLICSFGVWIVRSVILWARVVLILICCIVSSAIACLIFFFSKGAVCGCRAFLSRPPLCVCACVLLFDKKRVHRLWFCLSAKHAPVVTTLQSTIWLVNRRRVLRSGRYLGWVLSCRSRYAASTGPHPPPHSISPTLSAV